MEYVAKPSKENVFAHTTFMLFILQLYSDNDKEVENSEKLYKYLYKKFPNFLCIRLAMLSHCYTHPITRRRLFSTAKRLFLENLVGIWNRLTLETKSNFKEILLARLFDEKDPSVLPNLCCLVGTLAVYVLREDNWPEFEFYIHRWLSAEGLSNRMLDDYIILLLVDSMIPEMVEYFTEGFGKTIKQRLLTVCLSYTTLDPKNFIARVAAVKASLRLIIHPLSSDDGDELIPLLYRVMNMLENLTAIQFDETGSMLLSFNRLWRAPANFLKRVIPNVVQFFIKVAGDPRVGKLVQELAQEGLLSFAEEHTDLVMPHLLSAAVDESDVLKTEETCHMLCFIIRQLQGGELHTWFYTLAKFLVSRLELSLNRRVKLTVVIAMPLLMTSAIIAVESHGNIPGFNQNPEQELAHIFVEALSVALDKESNTEIRANILDSKNDILQIMSLTS